MEHATALLPKGFLQWWGAGPKGHAAVTPFWLPWTAGLESM